MTAPARSNQKDHPTSLETLIASGVTIIKVVFKPANHHCTDWDYSSKVRRETILARMNLRQQAFLADNDVLPFP